MLNGIINLDTEPAKQVGFTSDKFLTGSYLWKHNNTIIISAIFSKYPGKGNFSLLLDNIFGLGHSVEVPTPLPLMKSILKKKGFVREIHRHPEMGIVEIYKKVNPKQGSSANDIDTNIQISHLAKYLATHIKVAAGMGITLSPELITNGITNYKECIDGADKEDTGRK